MCTTRRPFQRLEGLLSNHLDQNQEEQQIIKWESALPKSFCNFFALSKMQQFPGKMQKCNFFADRFRKWENSLGTTVEHMQSRCMAGSAKKLSFLAIFCSSVCARLLVHVRCPAEYANWNQVIQNFGTAKRRRQGWPHGSCFCSELVTLAQCFINIVLNLCKLDFVRSPDTWVAVRKSCSCKLSSLFLLCRRHSEREREREREKKRLGKEDAQTVFNWVYWRGSFFGWVYLLWFSHKKKKIAAAKSAKKAGGSQKTIGDI